MVGEIDPGHSEAVRLRRSDADAADDRTRQDAYAPPTPGGATRLVQTTTVTTYPTAANRYYAVKPLDAMGTQTEGSSGVITDGPGTFYAFNLGTAIPPSGTNLVVTLVGYRWVFRWD